MEFVIYKIIKISSNNVFLVSMIKNVNNTLQQMVGVSDRFGMKPPGKVISVKKKVIRVPAFRWVSSRNRDISI